MQHNARHKLTLAMGLIFLVSMPCSADWISDARPLMGTEVSVYLWHENESEGRKLVEAVFDETIRIDELMSTYKDSSRISEVNRFAAGEAVYAGEELVGLIPRALDQAQNTMAAMIPRNMRNDVTVPLLVEGCQNAA